MMLAVRNSLEDADLGLLLMDVRDDPQANHELFSSLGLKAPALLVINKIDRLADEKRRPIHAFFNGKPYAKEVIEISALKKLHVDFLLERIIHYLPEGAPFFEGDELTDRPVKFFVSEIIREKIFELYEEEIPYHSTVVVQEFKEKDTLTKVRAEIIVHRESQKGIILGEGGRMIKKLGTEARKEIELFLDRKVFLELFVKVRPKWRDSELFLKEYGY